MGYRSDVAIAINKKAYFKRFIAGTVPELLDTQTRKESDNAYYWRLESIKWYETYPEIQAIEVLMGALDDEVSDHNGNELYGFIRLGDDDADVEINGDPYEYGLGYNRYISTPADDE